MKKQCKGKNSQNKPCQGTPIIAGYCTHCLGKLNNKGLKPIQKIIDHNLGWNPKGKK